MNDKIKIIIGYKNADGHIISEYIERSEIEKFKYPTPIYLICKNNCGFYCWSWMNDYYVIVNDLTVKYYPAEFAAKSCNQLLIEKII